MSEMRERTRRLGSIIFEGLLRKCDYVLARFIYYYHGNTSRETIQQHHKIQNPQNKTTNQRK